MEDKIMQHWEWIWFDLVEDVDDPKSCPGVDS